MLYHTARIFIIRIPRVPSKIGFKSWVQSGLLTKLSLHLGKKSRHLVASILSHNHIIQSKKTPLPTEYSTPLLRTSASDSQTLSRTVVARDRTHWKVSPKYTEKHDAAAGVIERITTPAYRMLPAPFNFSDRRMHALSNKLRLKQTHYPISLR